MNKIKSFFSWIFKIILTPIHALISIPITDGFIEFVNKHVWFRVLVSGLLAVGILCLVYFL